MERLEYRAELDWDGNVGSFARVREFRLRTDTNTDGGNEGPLPAEYLLTAIGGCLTINWGRLIKKMRLNVEEMSIEVRGWRNLKEPPAPGDNLPREDCDGCTGEEDTPHQRAGREIWHGLQHRGEGEDKRGSRDSQA
ncbi:OsmC family protein [Thermococcus sp.]